MPPNHRPKSGRRNGSPKVRLMPKLRQLAKHGPQMAVDFFHSWNLVKFLIACELIINYLVIKYVRYTEIDWSTYMVQVGQVFNGTMSNFNYSQITGPTGALVYPAGHLYVYYFLKELTDNGNNIKFAQHIFACIYICQLILVYKLYSHRRSMKVPPYIFIIMCLTSYRIHSIYVLRLFNDPVAILFAYASFYALLMKRYAISAFLFSFAIGIKMNILLFAPAYALIFYEDLGLLKSLKYGCVSIITQLALSAPFLYTDPVAYFSRAFNFGRVFLHKWTVNWRFSDEKTFTSPQFFKLLIGLHLFVLFIVYAKRWLNIILPRRFSLSCRRDDPILTLFVVNFVGVAFSRSLHYQFYVWYYHSLPMILWATRYSVGFKILILGCIECAWNEYPSTNFSSLLLHCCHFAILIGLLISNYSLFPKRNDLDKKSPGKSGKKQQKHL